MSAQEEIEKKEIICTICPNSCRLKVWKDPKTREIMIEGFKCTRGKDFGIQEFVAPTRMLITTMRIVGGIYPVIPVRSEGELPKEKIFDAIQYVNDQVCWAPVEMGDVLIKNIAGTGINVIASRNMDKFVDPKDKKAQLESEIQDILRKNFLDEKTELSQLDRERIKHAKEEIMRRLNEASHE